MKNTIPVAAATVAAILAVALSGCSPTVPKAPPKPINPPVVKTYTDSDLVKILNATNTSLNAGGTVTDIGLLSNQTYKPAPDVYGKILAQGGSFTPAACGMLFTKIGQDVASLGGNTGAFSAKLEYGSTIVSATSSSSSIDVSSLTSLLTGDLTALTQQCASAHVSIHGVEGNFAYQASDAKTDAGTTWAYTETGSIGSVTVGSVAVVALDGNLLIGYEGFNQADTVADGVTAVNAVVAAAESN